MARPNRKGSPEERRAYVMEELEKVESGAKAMQIQLASIRSAVADLTEILKAKKPPAEPEPEQQSLDASG